MTRVDEKVMRPIPLRVLPQNGGTPGATDSNSHSLHEEGGADRLRQETARGLRYCHQRINANTSKSLEVASFLYAMIEILVEKGLLTVVELDERKQKIAERFVQKFKDSGLGLMYQDPEYDKYTFEHESHVDCENRIAACRAMCCKFPFALSQQDIEEGIMQWDFDRPYLIAHGADGYCVHLDRATFECTVRDHRPVPCRGFDCRNNPTWHVWLDFENSVINSELAEALGKKDGRMNPKPAPEQVTRD